MKKYLLLVLALLSTLALKAQTGFDNSNWGIGAEASYVSAYTNLKKQVSHPGISISGIYNSYLPIVAEFQMSRLSGGGETPNVDLSGRYYSNNYMALFFHGDFQLSSVLNYDYSDVLNVIKGFYVGTGFGFVLNNVKAQRHNQYPQNGPIGTTDGFLGKDKSVSLTIPLRIGYEFKFFDSYNEQTMGIDIGYIQNIAFGEGLSGYNDPHPPFKNLHTDQYGQITVGIRYYFTSNYLP